MADSLIPISYMTLLSETFLVFSQAQELEMPVIGLGSNDSCSPRKMCILHSYR